jgi:hypothetical protein
MILSFAGMISIKTRAMELYSSLYHEGEGVNRKSKAQSQKFRSGRFLFSAFPSWLSDFRF